MNKNVLLLLIVCCLTSTSSLFSQDIITTKDGEKHEVKIREVTETVIKYNDYRDPDGIIFTMSRGLISEIEYEFGKTEIETEPVANELYYTDDRVNNLKFSFTALISNVLALTYERSLNPRSALELTMKIQGIEINDDVDAKSGFGLNLGYKLKFNSLFSAGDGYRPGHILSGGYIRPNLGFDIVDFENTFSRDESYNFYHFGVDFGIQWVIQNSFSMEIFGGPHFHTRNFDSPRGDILEDDVFANGEYFGITNGLGASFGFRMGFVFGNKKDKKENRKRRR